MKTIKQIADEIGVTKQAVFYHIKKPPLSNVLQSLMSKEDGVLMVSLDGETLIKQAFQADTVKPFDDKEPSKENTCFDSEMIKLFQNTIAMLREELEVKNEQIKDLTNTVKIQAQSINADRHNELADTLQKQLKDDTNTTDELEPQRQNRLKRAWAILTGKEE